MTVINIAIIDYPNSLKSALYGFVEMFNSANQIAAEQNVNCQFIPQIIDSSESTDFSNEKFTIILLPPSNRSDYYLTPSNHLLQGLLQQHLTGATLCSACAGTFILAATNLLKDKQVTTHWGLEAPFRQKFPEIRLNVDKILINQGNIITAGGMMSWQDLALEIICQYTNANVLHRLGKYLVIDTGQREQRFYRQFIPILNHGDTQILSIQHALKESFYLPQTIAEIATRNNLTERTFLRRFFKATQLKPKQYIQHLRIQRVCELLESSKLSFELIANQVGYEDSGACRKLFIRIIGLTPSEFRKRFVE
ncbi:GlxA family transcriptional regulator [Psychromonas algicola]|uniref:GlxA family transcriptional regulator n=1 Tax=Psychromonas algicola TaxID=2555642 RepID=UPI00106724E1|nr:helix-turn-helix domain-containing protein [Psychromonas sp. RZ5]TEW51682.1 helix-turn-helix domain-containing protein [Psychromonas sp. RZ5]